MKKVFIAVISILFLNGCIPVLLGLGALGGYALSTDSAVGNVSTEYRILWDICLDKLQTMEAEILRTDESAGLIKSRISEHDVTIKLKNINPETQRLKVSARRNLLPKPQFSQKVFFKIIEDLQ